MALSQFSQFHLRVTFDENRAWAESAFAVSGLATLFHALVTFGADHAISISETPDRPLGTALTISDDQWSLWSYSDTHRGWRYVVIGALSLDDIAVELVDLLQQDYANEIRICPPGTPHPRAI
jgi:hypothetical protein